MHKEHGKKSIIDVLYSNGFCLHYDDLRRFNTAVAKDEEERFDDIEYIPSGLQQGEFVHERADNVDIQVNTIYGFNTYHSMARVVFQESKPDAVVKKHHIKKSINKSFTSHKPLNMCIPYAKPAVRSEPDKVQNTWNLIQADTTDQFKSKDIAWVLLRMMAHDELEVPACV